MNYNKSSSIPNWVALMYGFFWDVDQIKGREYKLLIQLGYNGIIHYLMESQVVQNSNKLAGGNIN